MIYFYDDFVKYYQDTFKFENKDNTSQSKKRKDYCYECNNDKGYWHVMTFKCTECHKILLG